MSSDPRLTHYMLRGAAAGLAALAFLGGIGLILTHLPAWPLGAPLAAAYFGAGIGAILHAMTRSLEKDRADRARRVAARQSPPAMSFASDLNTGSGQRTNARS